MKILIPRKVAIKLKYYVKFAPGEVSGMAKSSRDEDDNIVIEDLYLFEQKCSAASTDIEDKSMMEFLKMAEERGESLKEWDVWWHSHGKIDVSWSSKDDQTIADNGTNLTYMISVVTNKEEKFLGRLDVYPKDLSPFKTDFKPYRTDLDVEYIPDNENNESIAEIEQLKKDIEKIKELVEKKNEELKSVEESLYEDDEMKEVCEKEIKEKVKEKFTQVAYSSGGKGSFYYQGKKKGSSEKKENEQRIFEDILFDIEYSMPAHSLETYCEYDSAYDDDWDSIVPRDCFGDQSFLCDDCGQHKVYCICEDALEKHRAYFEEAQYNGDEDDLSIASYIKNNFNGNNLLEGVSHNSRNSIHNQKLPFFKTDERET